MGHWDIGSWVDLVRGLSNKAERAKMEEHLSSGCRKCWRTVEILREVATMASAEGQYTVPQYAVQGARAIYALNQPERVYFFPRLLGRLVYDSFREPLPAGLRSRNRLTRHTLYEAADYSLDIRLEHQIGTDSVNLVGQITSQKEPDRPFANLPVLLVSGRQIVARAASNAFGEFQIEYEPQRRLRLYLQADQGGREGIEVPLASLSHEAAPSRDSKGRPRKRSKRD
ncbi:MAG TPA: hypothetical protein VE398_08875 [Acidobacteriota bacterium]|nr:hypothetical protein [Acidobacteriota bacterium]